LALDAIGAILRMPFESAALMTATLVSKRWPAPAMPSAEQPWRFGREVRLEEMQGAPAALQWTLKRNCSITPRQLCAVYTGLCVVSLGIALLFAWVGAPFVLAFTGFELLLLGVAFLVHARHAGDREILTLTGGVLSVEQHIGGRLGRAEFSADWLVVEPAAGQGSLVELSGQGQRLRVGRFLRPEHRAALGQELRHGLRRPRPAASATFSETEPKSR
jgi:uncharacterized membrane protein